MTGTISHDRGEESIEAKARWFRSLSLAERLDILREFTDLILEINPDLPYLKDAKPIKGRIQVLKLEKNVSPAQKLK